MKLSPVIIGAAIALALAFPARGDVGPDDRVESDTHFLHALQQAGLNYSHAERAIAAGNAVCGLISSGEPGLAVLEDLKAHNPEMTMDSAGKFAAIAARSYCPQQLG